MFTQFCKASIQDFRGDDRGAVAIIFALTAIMLMVVTGLAIDVGRAVHAGTKISAAIDAAVIAGVKGLRLRNMTNAQVEAVTKAIFEENLKNVGLTQPDIKKFDVIIDRAKGSVELDVGAEIPTVLGQLAGINVMRVPRRSVAIFESKDVEVGLQLDVTGSMSGSKIADLKLATKDLVDILLPDDSTLLAGRKIRIGLAPYAAGVNAGSYASLMNGGVSAPNSCVYERQDEGLQATDNLPMGSAVLKTKLALPSANNCSAAKVLPLTDDKTLLKNTVDTYTTGGTTAGHLGSAFAWYLISPNWSSIWPADSRPVAYNDGKTMKVAILMTDGEYNTVNGKYSGANKSKSSRFASDTCDAMKRKDVIVYTVGFKLRQYDAINTMSDCASGTANFYRAEDGNELRAAFQAIAEDISKLRLSE